MKHKLTKAQLFGFLLFCLISGCQKSKGELQNRDVAPSNLSAHEIKEGWLHFEKDGNLYKTEILKIGDTVFKNQVIQLDKQGKIDSVNSKFFRIEIPDTLKVGTNKGIAKLYTFNHDFEARASSVIIENSYPDGSIVKDTFSGDPNNLAFGVFGSKPGSIEIKGEISEVVLTRDSAGNYHKIRLISFFKENAYVAD